MTEFLVPLILHSTTFEWLLGLSVVCNFHIFILWEKAREIKSDVRICSCHNHCWLVSFSQVFGWSFILRTVWEYLYGVIVNRSRVASCFLPVGSRTCGAQGGIVEFSILVWIRDWSRPWKKVRTSIKIHVYLCDCSPCLLPPSWRSSTAGFLKVSHRSASTIYTPFGRISFGIRASLLDSWHNPSTSSKTFWRRRSFMC